MIWFGTGGGSSSKYPELGLQWAPTSNPTDEVQTWEDVDGSFVREWSWGYGRNDELGRFEAGTGYVLLDNRERTFETTFNAGPWFGNIRPRKKWRLLARWDGVEYPIFEAHAKRYPYAYPHASFDAVVRLDLADAFAILQGVDLAIGFTRDVEPSDVRLTAVLDAIGVPASRRDLDEGTVDVAAIDVTGTGTSGLDHAKTVAADSEFGAYFIAKDGKHTFHNRHRRLNADVLHTFTDDPAGALRYAVEGFEPSLDETYWWNYVRVGGADGDAAVGAGIALDQASVDADHPITRTVSSLLLGGPQQTLAEYQRNTYAEPQLRAPSLPLIGASNPDDMWPVILGLEIGDRVEVEKFATSADPMVLTQNVEGIRHTWKPGGPWETTVPTSPADTNIYWRLEDPVQGEIDSTFAIAP